MTEELRGIDEPARTIPVPTTISPQAQAFLSGAGQRIAASGSFLPADGGDGAEFALTHMRSRAQGFAGTTETIELPGGGKLYRVVPDGLAGRRAEATYVDIHGGAFIMGGGEMCWISAQIRAMENGVEVWAVDYRLAPDHPYPAALDDCLAAWREVLQHRKAADVVIAGGSAGGNLAAALLLRASAEGLPLPAGLILMTPVVDLTGAGDTRELNRFADVVLHGGGGDGPKAYVGGGDPADPLLSPIYGVLPPGWPPTLLSSGTRDLLLSDTVRMHRLIRRAGVRAELHVVEGAPHGGFFGGAPEDWELMGEFKRFCEEIWGL